MTETEQTPQTVVDAEIRSAALSTEKSFCVSAPAGSGKTELLTQRYLKLLANVEKPEQVLAMTFTRKAAAEMRERIVQALVLGQATEAPQEAHRVLTWQLAQQALQQDRQQAWHLLSNPLRLRIQTIDSLSQSVARDQPVLSQIGGSLQTVDDATLLYQQAVDSFLQALNSDSNISDDLVTLLTYFDNNLSRITRLFLQMLPLRDQWLPHVAEFRGDGNIQNVLDQSLQKWIEQTLAKASHLLIEHASDISLCADFAASVLEATPSVSEDSPIRLLKGITDLPDCTIDQHEKWLGIVELLLTKTFTPRKTFNKSQGFPPKSDKEWGQRSEQYKSQLKQINQQLNDKFEVLDALKALALLPTAGYQAEHRQVLEPLSNCLLHLYGHLKIVFGERQQCDHNEMSARALQALNATTHNNEQGSATGFRWSQQIKHILVDEFQDTSVGQFQLLRALTSEWYQANQQQVQHPQTLFIVGDGMQSIYSFRAAKVGLFLQAKQQGIGDLPLTALDLKQNFRSTVGIVDWVNQHFSVAFPSTVDLSRGAVPYSYSVSYAAPQEQQEPAVEIFACPTDDNRNSEAAKIVQQIQHAQAKQADIEIAILVRARSHLQHILPALDQANIAWQGVDIDPLNKREVVMDCLTLIRALLNPADNIAWYALLRAPWCGLTLKDLQVVADALAINKAAMHYKKAGLGLAEFIVFSSQDKTNEPIYYLSQQLSSDGLLRFNALAKCLQVAWRAREKNSLRHWLESTWRALGGDCLAAHSFDGDDNASANAFFNLVETLEKDAVRAGQHLQFSDLERHVKRLYATPIHTAGSKTTAPIQIMTIHKSKGLEFDMVILPGLDKGSPAADKPLLMTHERVFDDGSSGLALYPLIKQNLLARDNKRPAPTLYDFLRAEDKRVKELESLRLLYVAVTRAKSKLVLLAALDRDSDDQFKSPSAGSLLTKIWPTVNAEIQTVEQIFSQAQDVDTLVEPIKETVTYAKLKRFTSDALTAIHQASNNTVDTLLDNDAQSIALDSALDTELDTTAFSSDEPQGDQTAPAIGTCVHEIFEQIGRQSLQQWRLKDLSMLKPYWLLRLKSLGLRNEHSSYALTQVERAVSTVLNSKTGSWIFDLSHSQAQNEWALTQYNSDSASSIIIDRSFIDKHQTRWIVDYKVTEPSPNEYLDTFIENQKQAYSAQLQRYSLCVKALDISLQQVKQTKSVLYFPLLDQLLEV